MAKKKIEEIKKSKLDVTLKVLAYAIPLMILLWVVYMNWLPFGYSDTLVIDVGSLDDTSGEFRLIESSSLGSRQELDGKTFRYVDGIVQAVYTPKVPLRNATINVTLVGDNVYFVSPPDVSSIDWDYDFSLSDFVVEAPQSMYNEFLKNGMYLNYDSIGVIYDEAVRVEQTEKSLLIGDVISWDIPDYYLGSEHEIVVGQANGYVYLFVDGDFKVKEKGSLNIPTSDKEETIAVDSEGCWVFDGNTRLIYPNSSDMFEDGPFTVYVEWIPEKAEDRQQLIGHYNWEIYQDSDNVAFTVGRMNDNNGDFYTVEYPVDTIFFDSKHRLLASYNPEEGLIELFVDNEFIGSKNINGEEIFNDYNRNILLSLGKNFHNLNTNPYFYGNICNAKILNNSIGSIKNNYYYESIEFQKNLYIEGSGKLLSILLKVDK